MSPPWASPPPTGGDGPLRTGKHRGMVPAMLLCVSSVLGWCRDPGRSSALIPSGQGAWSLAIGDRWPPSRSGVR